MSLSQTNVHPGQLAYLNLPGGTGSVTLSGATLFVVTKLSGVWYPVGSGDVWTVSKNGNPFAGGSYQGGNNPQLISIDCWQCIGDEDVVSLEIPGGTPVSVYVNGLFWAPWN